MFSGILINDMISKIINQWSSVKEKNTNKSSIQVLFIVLSGVKRIVMAKWYLRKCTSLGRMVSTNGKPMIKNEGIIDIDDEVRIWSNIVESKLLVGENATLSIGKNSRINGTHIGVRNKVQIGANCRIAPYTVILDSDFHDVNNHFAELGGEPIIIEDDVWITTRVTLLKGVTIGQGSVIATGSVVNKSVPPYCLYGGVPAKFIKHLKKD